MPPPAAALEPELNSDGQQAWADIQTAACRCGSAGAGNAPQAIALAHPGLEPINQMGTAEARRRKVTADTDGGVAKSAAAVAPAASPKKRASSPTKKRAPPAAASKGAAEGSPRLRSLAYLAAVLAAAAAVWAAGRLRRPFGGGEPAVESGAVNGHFPAGCTWREAFPKVGGAGPADLRARPAAAALGALAQVLPHPAGAAAR